MTLHRHHCTFDGATRVQTPSACGTTDCASGRAVAHLLPLCRFEDVSRSWFVCLDTLLPAVASFTLVTTPSWLLLLPTSAAPSARIPSPMSRPPTASASVPPVRRAASMSRLRKMSQKTTMMCRRRSSRMVSSRTRTCRCGGPVSGTNDPGSACQGASHAHHCGWLLLCCCSDVSFQGRSSLELLRHESRRW